MIMEVESMEAMCDDSCSCNGHICALSFRISQMEELLDKVLEQVRLKEEKKRLALAEREKNLSVGSTLLPFGVRGVYEISEAFSLHDAAKLKNTPALARFLARGADPNAVDTDGNTALHCAARSGDALAAELLLACGAALEAKNSNASTPLLMAAWSGHLEVANVLIQEGAQIDEPDKAGQTPLMCAVILQNADMVSFLERRGASLVVKDANGDTPVIIAAKSCFTNSLKILINSPRVSVEEMMKALKVAGSLQAFRILINAVPLSKICSTKHSLLPRLAERGWEKPIELLLYVCRKCEDEDHMKNLQQAVSVADSGPLLLKLWRTKPLKLRKVAMHRSAVKGWLTELDVILQHWKIDLGLEKHLDEVQEALSATRNPEVMLRLLEAQGWSSYSNIVNETLWRSAEHGWVNMLGKLIEVGVPVDVARSDGATALHCAAERGHDSCVKLLLNKGASPNVRNDVGWTPLHVAADAGHRAVMKSLLSAGADPNIKDPVGCTPFDVGIDLYPTRENMLV